VRKGKSLKVVSLWASMLLLASVLAACAESSAPAANTTAPAPKPAAGATQGTGQTVPADAKSTVSLTYATYTAESMFFHENHKYWGAELEKRSGGRAKVDKWLWGGSLLKADQMTSGIGTGMATVGYVCPSYNPANWPLMSMADAIYKFYDAGPKEYAIYKLWQDNYAPLHEEFTKNNLYPVIFDPGDETILGGVGKPVKTLEDLKGRKIRSFGMLSDVLNSLGAVPVAMSSADIYTSLERKTIDGFTGQPAWCIDDFKYYEIISWAADPGFGDHATCATVMNLDTYKGLPDDIKKIVNDLQLDTLKRQSSTIYDRAKKALVNAAKKNIEVYSLTDAEKARWRQTVNPEKTLYPAWLDEREKAGAPARDWFDKLTALLPEGKKWTPYPGAANLFSDAVKEAKGQ